jgi:hypothetical protein
VLLPYTIEQDGSYKPDFESQERFKEFQKFLNDFPDITNVEKLEKAKTLGLDVTYDSRTGNFVFNTNAVKTFIIMTGYASSRVMPLDEDSK